MIEAFPEAKRRVPALRMVVVTGPRIDPGTFSQPEGLEVRGVRPRALPAPRRLRPRGRAGRPDDVHGADGEPTAVPLLPAAPPLRAELPRPPPPRPVRSRTADGLRACNPRAIATQIAQEIGREVDYRPVERDGAAQAAALIAELL